MAPAGECRYLYFYTVVRILQAGPSMRAVLLQGNRKTVIQAGSGRSAPISSLAKDLRAGSMPKNPRFKKNLFLLASTPE
jgi:hypothetical protein